MDESLISALEQALEREPDSASLRLHVAKVLLEAGRPAQALEHASALLGRQPDHREALQIAADAADGTGDKIRAQGYRRLLDGLGFQAARRMIDEVAPSEPTPIVPDDNWTPFDDEDDEPVRLGCDPFANEPDERDMWEATSSEVTLADVAGLEEVKRRLHLSFLGPLRNPDMRKLYGKSLRGGLMLYGPPGCGKTFLARALAGELGARFMSVALNDVVEMWLGQSERNLHDLFESARRHRPCVLFFDEIDALGRKRSLMRHSAGSSIVNQLLAELDGTKADNDELYVIAATNHPWDVDAALRRPGRLDRTLLVLPPDRAAREAIVKAQMSDRPTEKLDFGVIAADTEDFSGADMAHLCESAAEMAMEDSIRTGNTRPIRMGDFKTARKEVRPSIRPWLETAKNYALYSNDGGAYDDLLDYLRKRKLV